MKTREEIEFMIEQLNYEGAIAQEGYGYETVEESKQEIEKLKYAVNILKWVIEE